MLKPGIIRKHTRLLAPFQLRLKPYEAEVIAGEGVLTQLHGRVRKSTGARIGEPHRLHRAKSQRVLARDAP